MGLSPCGIVPAGGSWGRRASHYARVALPGFAGAALRLVEAATAHPVVPAAALAALALAAPSVLASGSLLGAGQHDGRAHDLGILLACRTSTQ